ncbi:MAG: hypothetical protein LBK83_02960 [Treponema sp.]|nr:hypothetical protein [Treponema sp.]
MAIPEKVPIRVRIGRTVSKTLFQFLKFLPLLILSIFPVSFVLMILGASGFLEAVSRPLGRVSVFFGFRGEALIAFGCSILGNPYMALTCIEVMNFSARELVILAMMCLTAHSLIAESGYMRRTGSSFSKLLFLRLFWALASGLFLGFILPGRGIMETGGQSSVLPDLESLKAFFESEKLNPLIMPWLGATFIFMVRTALIVLGSYFLQHILLEFGLLHLASRLITPFMPILGLPSHAAYPLITGFSFGIQEEYSVIREAFESASLSEKEADLLNHHIAIDHSWITATCLFAATGISTVWLLLPRILLAILVVWIEKLRRFLFRRSFRVHIGE